MYINEIVMMVTFKVGDQVLQETLVVNLDSKVPTAKAINERLEVRGVLVQYKAEGK